MGNDGGSIPDRRDLVRTKPKAEQADKANQTRARWHFCALSKKPLQEPVVSCALGKLYNREAIIEYLLDKTAYGDGQEICGHIRSLKDVKTLKLTPNPAPRSTADTTSDEFRPQFICPLTAKEMTGALPFVYIATCGCVFSHAGLKSLASSSPKDSPKDSATPPPAEHKQLDLCPQCGAKYDKSSDVLPLNPSPEEEEKLRLAMELKRAAEPAPTTKKGGKKRKADKVEKGEEGEAKKKARQPVPSMNPSIAAASKAVVSSLAMEEAKRKAGMSDAVKELYASKDGPKRKETFMTMGTFTRYA
ncbi:DUF602-domain-containing protein [Punctularia strigosozonata HHB-11173 SS5]|uniref:DUF602-domain-containing protein n=1 Tax=Punctularia strigosozonata (strain HHB-11173) TaxID=741275 RepID=UPI0004416912|nr:DUF602-domain-containing protein [Punctularia strigosozonata HHB-11173 SS5]EIN13171.1 DUF602-domain-containing protein [Punctularia strigosozonata HHB-11173 SS5]